MYEGIKTMFEGRDGGLGKVGIFSSFVNTKVKGKIQVSAGSA